MHGLLVLLQKGQSRAEPQIGLGEVGLQTNGHARVGERLLQQSRRLLAERRVGRRSIAVQHSVGGVESDGRRERSDGLAVTPGCERLIASILVLARQSQLALVSLRGGQRAGVSGGGGGGGQSVLALLSQSRRSDDGGSHGAAGRRESWGES